MQQYKKILGKVMMTAEGTYDSNKEYDPISLITDEETGKSYISRKEVPAGTQINNREYWQPVASSGIIDNGVIILNRKNKDGQVPIYNLKSAAEAVAVGDRKGGVILGFLGFNPETDTVPTWKLYQYNDVSPSNWTNIDYWLPMDYTNKYVGWFDNEKALYDNVPFPKVGMYAYVGNSVSSAIIYRCYKDRVWQPTEDKAFSGVVNLADEEDITSKQNKLKFKDKEYNPTQFSGLGKLYLRKNIIDGKNILMQDMMQATNTIYIIQYDYDLQGETITIPENCTLDFQGGSFSNGTIVGNKTKISGVLTYSIFNNCVVKDFDLPYIDIRWTGAVSDCDLSTGAGTDSSDAIQMAINNIWNYHTSSYIYVSGNYYIGKTIETAALLLKGDDPVGFDWGYDYSKDYKFKHSSAFYLNENITAFLVTGYNRTDNTTTYSYVEVENIYITAKPDYSNNSTFIKHTASGFPSRPGWMEKVSAQFLDKLCHYELLESSNTYSSYYSFTVDKCYVTHCNYAIYAESYAANKGTIGGFDIKDSVLEQGARIYIECPFGEISIHDNLLEGQSDTIIIKPYIFCGISVFNNYFEANTNDIINIEGHNANVSIYHNYFENCADGKVTVKGNGSNASILRAYSNYGNAHKSVEFISKGIALYQHDKFFKNNISGFVYSDTYDLKVSEVISVDDYNISLPTKECFYDTIKGGTTKKGVNIYNGINIYDNSFIEQLYVDGLDRTIQAAKITTAGTLSPSYTTINAKAGDLLVCNVYSSIGIYFQILETGGSGLFTVNMGSGININIFKFTKDVSQIMPYARHNGVDYYLSIPIFYHIPAEIANNIYVDDIKKLPMRAFANGGPTDYRPKLPISGQMYTDTTLNKPIWWTGSKWIDATGTEV